MPAKSRLETSQPIGIIAGSGALFSMVWNRVLALGLQPVVITFKGAGHPFHDDHTPCLHTTLGKIGEILNFLKSHGVKQLIFAGRIARPTFSSLSFDTVGLRWMQKLGVKTFGGDDTLLKGITELLTQEGFEIISPREFLPNLVLKPGIHTQVMPSEDDLRDIARGQTVLSCLSGADVGQACVVEEGLILGVEAIEGTQKLIERCGPLKRKPKGGVLVKIAKRNQSTLVDLPTIGAETVEEVRRCSLSGIAISAHTTQVLEFNRVIDLCNQYGVFLKVI